MPALHLCHCPQAKSQLREMAEEHVVNSSPAPVPVPGGKTIEECEEMIRKSFRSNFFLSF